jgi:hypothetical protein
LKHISEIQKHGSRNGDIALANHFEYIYDSSFATLTTCHFTALYRSSLTPSPLVNLARLFLLNRPPLWFWWNPILHSEGFGLHSQPLFKIMWRPCDDWMWISRLSGSCCCFL